MPFVIKTKPCNAVLDRVSRFAAGSIKKYGGNKIQVGDEVFIWFFETKGGTGLSWRGVAQGGPTRGVDKGYTVDVRLENEAQAPYFGKAKLNDPRAAYDGTAISGLTQKLLTYSPSHIAELTEDEAELLRSYFRLPNIDQRKSGTQSEQEKRLTPNPLSRIEADFEKAELSEIDPRTRKLIDDDLPTSAIEGMTAERWGKVRRRASWLADTFIRQRQTAGTLKCDDCEFDPAHRSDLQGIVPRSLLDVHHKAPLEEGVRETTTADFALLCPTCHRIIHSRLRLNAAKPGES